MYIIERKDDNRTERAGDTRTSADARRMGIALMPDDVERVVLERLNAAGYEAFLVGGRVRTVLAAVLRGGHGANGAFENERETVYPGKAVEADRGGACIDVCSDMDIDVATDARPEDVKRVFHDMRVIETGIRHGTVTVLVPEDGQMSAPHKSHAPFASLVPVEITTYRTESGYSDGRHPDSVEFSSSITEDLARRDITVNAVAVDAAGNIVDPFGGTEDLKDGVIRAVDDPDQRLGEDGLRIMRTLRFASCLGFDIEHDTEAALFRNSRMLRSVSAERVFGEMKKLVTGADVGRVVRKYVDIIGVILPELSAMKGFEQHNEYHRYDVLEHCVRAMEAVRTNGKNRVYMKMAALLHDVGKPLTYSNDDTGRGHFYGHASKGAEVVEKIFHRLRADRAMTEHICLLIKYHDLIFEKDERLLKKWMNRFGADTLFEVLEIKRADNLATGNMSEGLKIKFDEIEGMMRLIVEEGQCFSVVDLAVNGGDMIALGIKEGPEVGAVLNDLLEAVIDGGVPNEREALLKLAIKLMK